MINTVIRRLKRTENNGSVIIEMCFIAPVLIGVVFLCISLFFVVMNKSIAIGETYASLYTKEAYILVSGQSYISDIKSEIESRAKQIMGFAGNINAEIKENKKSNTLINNLKPFDEGVFAIEISYENILKGVIILKNKSCMDRYEAKQEIRDTSSNLRRWQMYGYSFSD